MSNPSFTRPSQGHLKAFDFLMKVEVPFTRQEFIEGVNHLSEARLKPNTASSYLRGFRDAGILKEAFQYPWNVWELTEDWDLTEAADRLKKAYYYS